MSRHTLSKAQFDVMAEEATADCHDESEATGGWFNMIEENLKVPFETQLLGMPVTVESVGIDRRNEIVAVCCRGKHRQAIPIQHLPIPSPPPEGAQWIEAYRRWSGGLA